MKTALICGITGQDGTYLANHLLGNNYAVFGTSRDAQRANMKGLQSLNISEKVTLISMASNDFRSVLDALVQSEPDEVYYLAGQSSVGLSFDQPSETLESITLGTLNLLEAIRFLDIPIKLYHASSSECYGDLGEEAAIEGTPFRPRSPYAIAKASAHWLIANYREAYGMFSCNGISFNHESPLRPERFVTKKIISAACRIANGSSEKLKLGRLDIVRDWGWAPEYVDAMWRMLQQENPDDYIIATGKSYSLEKFVNEAFSLLSLEWKEHVSIDESIYRPTDISRNEGNPTYAEKKLGWKATVFMSDVVKKMIKAEMEPEHD